jgi:CBS-domain-containing membrane protein
MSPVQVRLYRKSRLRTKAGGAIGAVAAVTRRATATLSGTEIDATARLICGPVGIAVGLIFDNYRSFKCSDTFSKRLT